MKRWRLPVVGRVRGGGGARSPLCAAVDAEGGVREGSGPRHQRAPRAERLLPDAAAPLR